MARIPIAIVGPTATGKTETAIHVAAAVDGEIVSVDSMAVYRHMDIGTAKPDAALRERIPFHLLDVVAPDAAFNAADFKRLARAAMAEIDARGRTPLLVGGTGLYLRVVLEDFGLTSSGLDTTVRAALDREADELGSSALHARLVQVDPVAAGRIHPNDRVRIVRALEVYVQTGVPISVQQARDAESRARLPAIKFGLTLDREALYRRIDARVDAMIAAGLEAEVRTLLARGYDRTLSPLRSLGYKEMVAAIREEIPFAEAVAAIKQNTRRFAKRQWTWFRADPELIWVDVSNLTPRQVAQEIISRLPA